MGLEEELFKLSMMGVKGKKRECSRQGEYKYKGTVTNVFGKMKE